MTIQLFEDRTLSVIEQSLSYASAIMSAERITDASRTLDYYHSIPKQKSDLYQQYLSQYHDTMAWYNRPKTCFNLTAGVAETLSTLYHDPVRRKFGEGDKRAEDLWAEVQGFDSLMQDIDLYTLLTGTVAVRPLVTEAGVLKYAVYPSHQIEYTPDPRDPTIAQEVALSWSSGTGRYRTIVRHFWTAEEFIETVDDVMTGESGAHGYGFIPLIFFRNRSIRWNFFDEPAADMVEANLTLNHAMTSINDIVSWQTHGQLLLIGAPEDYVPKIGWGRYLKIPAGEGADARYINPNADISKAIEVVNKNLEMFFSARRIPESAIIATQRDQSGVAIVAEQAALRDYRKRRINQFRPLESELIRMTLTIMDYHKTGRVQEYEAPDIDYTELKAPMDAQEQNEWDWKLLNDLATPVDYLMSRNPDLTEDEALEIYDNNRAFNQGRRNQGRAEWPEEEEEE